MKTNKRKHVDEILSVKHRARRIHTAMAHIRLFELRSAFKDYEAVHWSMLRYFPVGLVTCMEVFFKASVKELIDFGSPFIDRASGLDLKFDYGLISAVHGKVISLGDIVAKLSSFNSLEDINSTMSILTGTDFLDALKTVHDRWEQEINKKAPTLMIKDVGATYEAIKKTFELRHIFTHELPFQFELDKSMVENCLRYTEEFIEASAEFVAEAMYPNAPLTQSGMNTEAHIELKRLDSDLETACSQVLETLRFSDVKKQFKSSQKAWEKYRQIAAQFIADSQAKGGSIAPLYYYGTAIQLTKERIEHLKKIISDDEDGP